MNRDVVTSPWDPTCKTAYTSFTTKVLNDAAHATLSMEIGISILQEVCSYSAGRMLKLSGKLQCTDPRTSPDDDVKMCAKRNQNAVCVSVCAEAITSSLKNVSSKYWNCSIHSVRRCNGDTEQLHKGDLSSRYNAPLSNQNTSSRDIQKISEPVLFDGGEQIQHELMDKTKLNAEFDLDFDGSSSSNECQTSVLDHIKNGAEKASEQDGLDMHFVKKRDKKSQISKSPRIQNPKRKTKKLNSKRKQRENDELFRLNREIVASLKGQNQTAKGIKQECLICHAQFKSSWPMPRHIQMYHKMSLEKYKGLLTCSSEEREQRLLSIRSSGVPKKAHYNPKMGGNLPCDYCGEIFVGILSMQYHLRVNHHSEHDLQDKINVYRDKYRVLMAQNRRKSNTKCHRTNNEFPCRYCGMILGFACSRSRHELYNCIQNPCRQKRFYCQACGKSFLSNSQLAAHRQEHRKKNFKHECKICGKVTLTKGGMYQHKLKVHSGKDPKYRCDICGKEFYWNDKYQQHLHVHKDDRTFQCELCGKQFKTREAVTRHQKTFHNNQYKYHCPKCGHGMQKKQYLETHRCDRVRRSQNNANITRVGNTKNKVIKADTQEKRAPSQHFTSIPVIIDVPENSNHILPLDKVTNSIVEPQGSFHSDSETVLCGSSIPSDLQSVVHVTQENVPQGIGYPFCVQPLGTNNPGQNVPVMDVATYTIQSPSAINDVCNFIPFYCQQQTNQNLSDTTISTSQTFAETCPVGNMQPLGTTDNIAIQRNMFPSVPLIENVEPSLLPLTLIVEGQREQTQREMDTSSTGNNLLCAKLPTPF